MRSVHFVGEPSAKWVCNETEHSQNAEKLVKFLDNFREDNLGKEDKQLALKVWDVRCHKGEPCTCWYVGFKNSSEKKLYIILHFDITPKDIRVYFRHMDYMQGELKGWSNAWKEKCESVLFSENEKIILEETKRYIRKVYDALQKNQMRHLIKFKPSYPDDNRLK
jgi:hypothetical protein